MLIPSQINNFLQVNLFGRLNFCPYMFYSSFEVKGMCGGFSSRTPSKLPPYSENYTSVQI